MTTPLAFRKAEAADVPAIVAMLADDMLGAARESAPDDPVYRDAFARIAARAGDAIWLATAAATGEILGCAQLTILHGLSRRGASRALIEAVRVAGPVRRRGVGEALIRHLIGEARAAGCGVVQLTSDLRRADARRFYERLGFEHSHAGMKLML